MKIGVFTDLHANLPALKKSIEFFQKEKCTRIIHVGDLIAIGPYPKECMDLALSIEEMEFIMGNHDYWYAYGIPDPIPPLMNAEEVAHQKWTHAQIGEQYKKQAQSWVFSMDIKLSNQQVITFQHYALNDKGNWFQKHIMEPNSKDLDHLFRKVDAPFIFYGHNHIASDITGAKRYINLGSAGCYTKAEVRLAIVEFVNGVLTIQKVSLPYDDDGFMEAFEERQVPARDFIKKAFITREK